MSYLLSLLLSESVGDCVLDGRAWTFVDHRIPKRDLKETRDHQDQVCRVTQGNRHTPVVFCWGTDRILFSRHEMFYLLIYQWALTKSTLTHQSLWPCNLNQIKLKPAADYSLRSGYFILSKTSKLWSTAASTSVCFVWTFITWKNKLHWHNIHIFWIQTKKILFQQKAAL